MYDEFGAGYEFIGVFYYISVVIINLFPFASRSVVFLGNRRKRLAFKHNVKFLGFYFLGLLVLCRVL